MNPYDDEPTSRRSRQPRSDADPYPGGYEGGYDDRGGRDRGYDARVGGYDALSPGPAPAGRAPVGRASVGRASVGRASADAPTGRGIDRGYDAYDPPEPRYGEPYGMDAYDEDSFSSSREPF